MACGYLPTYALGQLWPLSMSLNLAGVFLSFRNVLVVTRKAGVGLPAAGCVFQYCTQTELITFCSPFVLPQIRIQKHGQQRAMHKTLLSRIQKPTTSSGLLSRLSHQHRMAERGFKGPGSDRAPPRSSKVFWGHHAANETPVSRHHSILFILPIPCL